jgi:hypothetical protein
MELASGEWSHEEPEEDPIEEVLCPRCNEIQDYLFSNYLKLALDTMTFPMPEHNFVQLYQRKWRPRYERR